MLKQELENPMLRSESRTFTHQISERIECDCGALAKMTVNGNKRCFGCAEDEGVTVYPKYRRYEM